MLDRISTVQYTGGRSTPSTDLARERALQAQRQADTWQMDLHLCNSPSHKIQILLASARDHELQKLSHLLKQGCLSMGEHRKLRDDVRDAYAALAKESLQLLENTARRYSSNSSSSNGSSSSSSSSSPGRKEADSPALSTSPSAVTAAPLPSSSTPSASSLSMDTRARERSLAVEGTYKQLVSMFSSLFPWSDTVLFDPSMCPPLFFQQQQQHVVQQQRPQRGGGGPLPPPPPPAFGHSGLGVLRSFQQIQNIAMQKVRLMMSNKQNRLQSAEHALEQWRWHKRSSSAAACSSSGSSSSSSLSEHNNDDDENEDDAGLLVHNTNNSAEDEKDKVRRQQKKDGGGGGGAITDDEADWRDHSTSVSPPNTTDPSTATPPSVLW